MTDDDEIEREREALQAILDSGEPMTEDERRDFNRRVAAVAAADMARPKTPLEEALAEVLAETVALADRTFPPGLNMRFAGEMIEILSRGEVIATVNQPALLARAAEIEAERRRDAGHRPN